MIYIYIIPFLRCIKEKSFVTFGGILCGVYRQKSFSPPKEYVSKA